MFYNNPDVPIYEANKVYEVEDNMVNRWLIRGGEIVEDAPHKELKIPEKESIPDGKEDLVDSKEKTIEDIPEPKDKSPVSRRKKIGKRK
jgi:hypothetical protein